MDNDIKDLIKIPSDLLLKEKYGSMNSIDKERYVYKTLKKILELNPNGVMISTVVKATGITHSTVWHHLYYRQKYYWLVMMQIIDGKKHHKNHVFYSEPKEERIKIKRKYQTQHNGIFLLKPDLVKSEPEIRVNCIVCKKD